MNTKWGLKIINLNKCGTAEEFDAAYLNAEPISFRKAKDCFEYLGFKLPRIGFGYVDTKYCNGITIEYILEPLNA